MVEPQVIIPQLRIELDGDKLEQLRPDAGSTSTNSSKRR